MLLRRRELFGKDTEIKMTLVWTNPSGVGPAYSGGTITADFSKYDYVYITGAAHQTNGYSESRGSFSQFCAIDGRTNVLFAYNLTDTNGFVRTVVINNTSCTFGVGYHIGSAISTTVNNNLIIPYRIYGVNLLDKAKLIYSSAGTSDVPAGTLSFNQNVSAYNTFVIQWMLYRGNTAYYTSMPIINKNTDIGIWVMNNWDAYRYHRTININNTGMTISTCKHNPNCSSSQTYNNGCLVPITIHALKLNIGGGI